MSLLSTLASWPPLALGARMQAGAALANFGETQARSHETGVYSPHVSAAFSGRANGPMSARTTAPAAGLPRVPLAIFLPRPDHTWPVPADLAAEGAWCGITAPDVAGLVAWYTKPRDLVAGLDGHRLVARAAAFLDRRPVTLTQPTTVQAAQAGP